MFYRCRLTFCLKHSLNIRQMNVKKILAYLKLFSKSKRIFFQMFSYVCRMIFLRLCGFCGKTGMFLYENCTDLQRFLPSCPCCFLRKLLPVLQRPGRVYGYVAGNLFLRKSINNVYPVFLFVKCFNVCFCKKVFNTASFSFNV